MKDAYEEEGCEFLNEEECEERLDDRGMKREDAEDSHYGWDDD